jgi:hypothetical protein
VPDDLSALINPPEDLSGVLDVVPLTLADQIAADHREINALGLAELSRHWALFNHGALFTYAGMDFRRQDPVREFIAARNLPGAAALHDCSLPLFQGVARRDSEAVWDRRLGLIKRAYWPDLLNWLAQVIALDADDRCYHRAVPQTLRIVDQPLALRNPQALPPPTVEITMFGVSGTVHHVRWKSDVRTPQSVAQLVRMDLSPEIRREAQRVFDGEKDPLRPRKRPRR